MSSKYDYAKSNCFVFLTKMNWSEILEEFCCLLDLTIVFVQQKMCVLHKMRSLTPEQVFAGFFPG